MTSAREPILLTPGPLTTAAAVRQAMVRDWGDQDAEFRALTARMRRRLVELAGAEHSHVCVPVQGGGGFTVEAAIGTLVPRHGRILVLMNGALGRRMAETCAVIGRDCLVLPCPEAWPHDPDAVDAALHDDPTISHVGLAHCEPATGLLNPLEAVADAVSREGRSLIVDATVTYGALPLDAASLPCDAVIATPAACLESVPGFAFVIAAQAALAGARGNAHSLALDLYEQWGALDHDGTWTDTPPTHAVAALDRALDLLAAEGGVPARHGRYLATHAALIDGMRGLGFHTLLPDDRQAPVIAAFHAPRDRRYRFERLSEALRRRGYVIAPGLTREAATFRIGCMGAVGPDEMRGLVLAITGALRELSIRDLQPAGPAAP